MTHIWTSKKSRITCNVQWTSNLRLTFGQERFYSVAKTVPKNLKFSLSEFVVSPTVCRFRAISFVTKTRKFRKGKKSEVFLLEGLLLPFQYAQRMQYLGYMYMYVGIQCWGTHWPVGSASFYLTRRCWFTWARSLHPSICRRIPREVLLVVTFCPCKDSVKLPQVLSMLIGRIVQGTFTTLGGMRLAVTGTFVLSAHISFDSRSQNSKSRRDTKIPGLSGFRDILFFKWHNIGLFLKKISFTGLLKTAQLRGFQWKITTWVQNFGPKTVILLKWYTAVCYHRQSQGSEIISLMRLLAN